MNVQVLRHRGKWKHLQISFHSIELVTMKIYFCIVKYRIMFAAKIVERNIESVLARDYDIQIKYSVWYNKFG